MNLESFAGFVLLVPYQVAIAFKLCSLSRGGVLLLREEKMEERIREEK